MGTGFAGRRAVFELLKTTDEMRDIILRKPSLSELEKAIAATKFVKLAQSGYLLVAQGVTSLDEIERSM